MHPTGGDADGQPSREEIDGSRGPLVLEFGARWCGHCRALRPTVDRMFEQYPGVVHVPIEDGPGLPLGRSFGVKLWPTLVFLRDGRVLARAARPSSREVREGFEAITREEAGDPG